MSVVDATQATPAPRHRPVFFSPVFDLICLGGGSLILLPLLAWLAPADFNPRAFGVGLLLSTIIIHPHFAHSYQIFYRTFGNILSDAGIGWELRLRYLWAGVAAPLFLILFILGALIWGSPRVLGYAGNLMVFLVGWHYVRQGYGVLIADTVLRRCFFSIGEKRALLLNAHVCWIVAWLAVNHTVAERDLFGLSFVAIELPTELLWAGGVLTAFTTLHIAWVLIGHGRRHRGAVPLAGIGAYLAALYPWVFLIRAPALAALIPALHALQYLVLVWRYQINLGSAQPPSATLQSSPRRPWLSSQSLRVGGFVLRGILLGVIGFWALPKALNMVVPYDHGRYGDYLFFFILYVFINIHHYFLDNAMWRKENPHTLRHLFAHAGDKRL
jgi:hypothetical protein